MGLSFHFQPTINIHNKPIIWVLGGPGIGKGVQCDLLRKRYGFTHLSIGEVLRGEVRKGGERSVFLHSTMKKGKLSKSALITNGKESLSCQTIDRGWHVT